MKLTRAERDLLARAAGIGGTLAASEQAGYVALLKKLVEAAIEGEERPAEPPLKTPRSTGRSTA